MRGGAKELGGLRSAARGAAPTDSPVLPARTTPPGPARPQQGRARPCQRAGGAAPARPPEPARPPREARRAAMPGPGRSRRRRSPFPSFPVEGGAALVPLGAGRPPTLRAGLRGGTCVLRFPPGRARVPRSRPRRRGRKEGGTGEPLLSPEVRKPCGARSRGRRADAAPPPPTSHSVHVGRHVCALRPPPAAGPGWARRERLPRPPRPALAPTLRQPSPPGHRTQRRASRGRRFRSRPAGKGLKTAPTASPLSAHTDPGSGVRLGRSQPSPRGCGRRWGFFLRGRRAAAERPCRIVAARAPLGPLFPAAERLQSPRGQLLAAAGGKFGTRVRAAPVDDRLGEGLFPYKERMRPRSTLCGFSSYLLCSARGSRKHPREDKDRSRSTAE